MKTTRSLFLLAIAVTLSLSLTGTTYAFGPGGPGGTGAPSDPGGGHGTMGGEPQAEVKRFANTYEEEWVTLLSSNDIKGAKELCGGWLKTEKGDTALIEAHKCLANVAMGEATVKQVPIGKTDKTRSESDRKSVKKALSHLLEASKLDPNDYTTHNARLHIMFDGGLFSDMAGELDKSVTAFGVFDTKIATQWVQSVRELKKIGELKAALDSIEVLYKHYPDSLPVVSTYAEILAELKRHDEAIDITKKAVTKNPDDSLTVWNYAKQLDLAKKYGDAEKQYIQALKLEGDSHQGMILSCVVAKFLEEKIKDHARACELTNKYCETIGDHPCDKEHSHD